MFYVKHNRQYAPHSDHLVTIQSAKDECDINKILSQYKKTGIINHVNSARPTYEDLPDHLDYQQSLLILSEAEQAFELLPSKVRDHFGNDPGRFLASFSDASQADQLREFGLLRPLVDPTARVPQAPSAPAPVPGPAAKADVAVSLPAKT